MTEFYKLPDYMKVEEIRKCFIEYLIYYVNNTSSDNIEYALNELLELSDRQWNTYELIDYDLKSQIEKYLIQVLNFQNEEVVDLVLCIIPRLGLENAFLFVQRNKVYITNKKILDNIKAAEEEYGKDVKNPYFGMENC